MTREPGRAPPRHVEVAGPLGTPLGLAEKSLFLVGAKESLKAVLGVARHLRTASGPRLTGTEGAAAFGQHLPLCASRGGAGAPPATSPAGLCSRPGAWLSSPGIVHPPTAPCLGAPGHRQGWSPCCTFLSQRGAIQGGCWHCAWGWAARGRPPSDRLSLLAVAGGRRSSPSA